MGNSRFTNDDDLRLLANLEQLRSLSLRETTITDTGLALLTWLPNLKELYIAPRLTNTGLTHLWAMPRLEKPEFNSPINTDDGMRNFGELSRLSFLKVGVSQLSDAVLQLLATLYCYVRLNAN